MNHPWRATNWQITSFEVSRVHLIWQTSLLYSSFIPILSPEEYPLMTRPISPTEGPMDPGKKLIGSLALQQVKSALHSQCTGWHFESSQVISGKQTSSSIFSFLKPSSQNPGPVQWQLFRTFWNAKWLVNSNCKPLKGYLSSTAAGKETQQWATHISNLCTTDTKRATCGCHFDHLECYSDHPKANSGMGLPKLSVHEIQASQCFYAEPETIKIPTNSFRGKLSWKGENQPFFESDGEVDKSISIQQILNASQSPRLCLKYGWAFSKQL